MWGLVKGFKPSTCVIFSEVPVLILVIHYLEIKAHASAQVGFKIHTSHALRSGRTVSDS